MALTHTVAGLRAELDAFHTALNNADWETARKEANGYQLTWLGLPTEVRSGGEAGHLPKPGDLFELIKDNREVYNTSSSTTPRIIQARVRPCL